MLVCMHTLAMSLVMIQHGHSIDSIIILGGLGGHPRHTIHNLCKPLHHLVKCHQLALLQDRIYFTFPNTHNCLVLMVLTRVLAALVRLYSLVVRLAAWLKHSHLSLVG